MQHLKLTVLILALMLNFNATARREGQAKIDSLLQEIPHAKNDSQKVILTAAVSLQLQAVNPDEGIKYGKQAWLLQKA